MNLILNTVNKYINIYSEKGFKSYLISLSGGLDSMVLLDILYNIKNNIRNDINVRVIHINYNININSNNWKYHCINECKKRNFIILTKDIFINNNYIKKYGIEFCARKIRLNIIYKNIIKKEIVLMAHHKNDNIETFFLHLKRGNGICGLSLIKDFNIINNIKILRPLLKFNKNELKFYAKLKNIKWIEDNSNKDNSIDRNFIRNNIIKTIENKWINFINISYKNINLINNQKELVNKIIIKDLKKIINKNNFSINIKKILNNNEFYIKNILILWIKKRININCSYKIINNIYYNLIIKKNFNNFKIEINNKFYISIYKYCLFIIKYEIKTPYEISINKINKNIKLPNNIGNIIILYKPNFEFKKNKIYSKQYIRKNNIFENISIKINKISNKYKLETPNFNKKTTIKNIFQKYNIPYWKRINIPMLFYNDKLISILNLTITKEANSINKNNLFNIIWYK